MSKLENLQICIKDGEVIALQGLDTVTADRLQSRFYRHYTTHS